MINRKNLVRGLIVMGLIAAMGAFFSGCDNNSSPTNNNQQTPLTAEFLIGGVWRADTVGFNHVWEFRADDAMFIADRMSWIILENPSGVGFGYITGEFGHELQFRITIINENRIRAVGVGPGSQPFYMNRHSE